MSWMCTSSKREESVMRDTVMEIGRSSVDDTTGAETRAGSLAREAAHLASLAEDRGRWGLIDEAIELRDLATVKRAEAAIYATMGFRPAS